MSAPLPTSSLISSISELETFVESVSPSCTLYVDLEGHRLSRNGNIAIITVLVHPQNVVKLIDVTTLKDAAFTTKTDTGQSLKAILENPNITKSFWDVRNDADALWSLYKIRLAGIIDIQLLENATRFGDKTYLRGLDKSVQYDLKPGYAELNKWMQTKNYTRNLMPQDIFNIKPLDSTTVQYCINDVMYLPKLFDCYMKRISPSWLAKAKEEGERRLQMATAPGYDPHSDQKRFGPWGIGSQGSNTDRFRY